MNLTLPAVLEVKFACPQCDQHIACDPAYCGTRIKCPSCQREMAVPDLAAFNPNEESTPPVPVWAGANGSREAASTAAPEKPENIALQSWFWLFFLGPMFLFFLGGGFQFRWLPLPALKILFFFCALIAGFLLGKKVGASPAGLIFAGLSFFALILVADVFVCYFGGCAMACTQAAAAQ